jgi:hypothetical protein
MKLKLILINLLFLSIFTSAQSDKGKFFVETGVKVFGGGDYQNFIGKTGISFNHSTRYWKFLEPDDFGSDSYKSFSFSLAPQIGYFLTENINGGLDLQYFYCKELMKFYNYFNNYWITTGGIFIRYYFLKGRISPFVETSAGLGISRGEENDQYSPGGAKYSSIEYQNLLYYALSSGITYSVNENFKFNLSVIGQNTIEKFSDKSSFSTDTYKVTNWEVSPMISIIYIFKGKTKTQK